MLLFQRSPRAGDEFDILIAAEWDKTSDSHGVETFDSLNRLMEVKVKMWIRNYVGFMVKLNSTVMRRGLLDRSDIIRVWNISTK